MASINAALQGAEREAVREGLHPYPRRLHSWATAVLAYYGYEEPGRPDIISGYRSPEKQGRMQRRWDRGDRAGLAARPATRSWHMHEDVDGNPASLAWDVETDVEGYTMYRQLMRHAGISAQLDLKVGDEFSNPDPGHFAVPMGERPPSIDRGDTNSSFADLF